MTVQTVTIMVIVFVTGLFLGTNLGVLLMCLLHAANDQP